MATNTTQLPPAASRKHIDVQSESTGWFDKTKELQSRQKRAQERLQKEKSKMKKPHRRAMPKDFPPRSKSTNSKPSKPQTRTLKTTVNSGDHTNVESHLLERFKNVSIREGSASSSKSSRSGRFFTGGSSAVRSGTTGCHSVEDVARLIKQNKAKNIVVMCGAGISTNSGIPDFRSPKTGLYHNLKQYNIPHPESMFDMDYFTGNPKPFFTLSKELYPIGHYRPNYVHYFLRMLHEKGVLLRIYTQNIDGLERLAGIPPNKLIEAHGSFYTSSCVRCKESYNSEMIRQIIFDDKIPRCHKNRCLGLIKPDVVFFGEDMPRKFYYYLKDFPQADLLIVMGTSLEVDPFAGIVDSVRMFVPRILFNRCIVGPFKKRKRSNDVIAKGDLNSQVENFTKLIGWKSEVEDLMNECEQNAQNSESCDLHPAFSPNQSSDNSSEAGVIIHPSSSSSTINTVITVANQKDDNGSVIPMKSNAEKGAQSAKDKMKQIFTSIPSNRLFTNHNRTGREIDGNSNRNNGNVVSPTKVSYLPMNSFRNDNVTHGRNSTSSKGKAKSAGQTGLIHPKFPNLTQSRNNSRAYVGFHSQTKLYRTENDSKPECSYFTSSTLLSPDSDESESETESDSSDD